MIRINASDIGIQNPVRVNETINNVKHTFEFQKNVIKVGMPQGHSKADRVISYYDGQIKAIAYIVDYISDVLNLSNKQIKDLRNTAFPKIQKLSNQIVTKMLHYDVADKEQKSGKK